MNKIVFSFSLLVVSTAMLTAQNAKLIPLTERVNVMPSIVPYKLFATFIVTSKVSPRRDKNILPYMILFFNLYY